MEQACDDAAIRLEKNHPNVEVTETDPDDDESTRYKEQFQREFDRYYDEEYNRRISGLGFDPNGTEVYFPRMRVMFRVEHEKYLAIFPDSIMQESPRKALGYSHEEGFSEIDYVRLFIDTTEIEKPDACQPLLAELDYTFERGLDRNHVERLAALEFVRDRKDLFITGPTGTGKSYLATALGNKACQDGYRVFYANTAKLISQLKIAKAKGTILTELKRIERADMLILNDFGMQAFDSQGRGIMMDIIEDRHQKRTTLITSQVPVKSWHGIIGEKTVADAILDRLVHHSLRVELFGESIRKRKSKSENAYE